MVSQHSGSLGIFPFTSIPFSILQSIVCSGKSVNLNSCFEVYHDLEYNMQKADSTVGE